MTSVIDPHLDVLEIKSDRTASNVGTLNSNVVPRLRIAFVSQPEYFRFMYEKDLECYAEIKEFELVSMLERRNFEDLIDFSADYNFFFRGEFLPANLLSRLAGKKVALYSEPFPRHLGNKLVYTRDSLRRYIDFRSSIRSLPFDYVFHYDEASLEFLARNGLLLSGAFPFPVATDTYVEQRVEQKWDMFFIGRSTPHRERFFGSLKHQFEFLHICHGIYGPPLIEYISQSKISLNVHAEHEISWEPRMQLLLAAGAFVISEPITPNRFLRPGIDYIEATSSSDMYEKVAYYLAHEEERHSIAASGKARVNELLNAKRNFLQLIDDLDQGKFPKFRMSKPSTVMGLLESYVHVRSALRGLARKLFQ